VYVKEPSEFRVSGPLVVELTRTAVKVELSISVSFVRMPGAATTSVSSSATVYALATATGASFTAATFSVTVATFESTVPSFALYVKESGPA
jgi:hypothetical protein